MADWIFVKCLLTCFKNSRLQGWRCSSVEPSSGPPNVGLPDSGIAWLSCQDRRLISKYNAGLGLIVLWIYPLVGYRLAGHSEMSNFEGCQSCLPVRPELFQWLWWEVGAPSWDPHIHCELAKHMFKATKVLTWWYPELTQFMCLPLTLESCPQLHSLKLFRSNRPKKCGCETSFSSCVLAYFQEPRDYVSFIIIGPLTVVHGCKSQTSYTTTYRTGVMRVYWGETISLTTRDFRPYGICTIMHLLYVACAGHLLGCFGNKPPFPHWTNFLWKNSPQKSWRNSVATARRTLLTFCESEGQSQNLHLQGPGSSHGVIGAPLNNRK